MVAKSQIALSPTEPKQASAKALSTAGGLVTSRVTTVPDDNETRAGITKAGTKLVISSDASKLSAADYQAMTTKAPNLTRALFPVPMVGPDGVRTKGSIFRATFQAGEKIRFQGTVVPAAVKKDATLVIERAPVTPDGKVGRFVRAHSIKPNKKNGKYLQDVKVREGLEVIRHRLLLREEVVGQRTINWAALEARAKAILDAEEQKLLAAVEAKLTADAKAALTKAEAALLKKLKVAIKEQLKSYMMLNMPMVGTGIMTVNFTSMKGSRDITLNLANWPQNGCDPTTTEDCTVSSIAVSFPDEASKTATFIAPTALNSIAFSADGEHGEKYTVNWSLDPNHTTTCADISPSPASLAKYGSTWDFQLNTNVQMLGYLSGNPANDMWSSQWSKDQNKGKTPLGCGFKGTQSFGTWWTNLAGWEKILIEVVVGIAVAATGIGLAADAISGMAVGAEFSADAADSMNAAIQVGIDTGEGTLTESDMLVEGSDYVIEEGEDGVKRLRRTVRGVLKQWLKADEYYATFESARDAGWLADFGYADVNGMLANSATDLFADEASSLASDEFEADLDGYLAEEASSDVASLADSFMESAISDAETFASNEVGTIVVN